MGFIIGIASSFFALAVGVLMRFIQDNKDGFRDGFDDSEEVLDVRA